LERGEEEEKKRERDAHGVCDKGLRIEKVGRRGDEGDLA